ncbi:MAG: MFS transporter [Gemmatimonadota bacterium]
MRPRTPLPAIALLALAGCATGPLDVTPSDAGAVLAQQALEGPSPATPGPYRVTYLTYGSGTDKNRAAYRDSVAIRTDSVDASKLVDLGRSAEERNDYWGFTPEGFPINARVWYPDGDGPFPLVLVVHGNHDPEDYSDPGYDYLGELLASRGFILASVDMNFINGGIREENDGRGWLLLKHLQVWRGFNEEAGNPFQGRVDMSRIAIMGHSRGGEAVGHAAAFNRLDRYPDDASLEFDFGFDIRSVVAIAPVDGQYLPTGRKVPVEDVNYLVFHGSHDGDVTSFHGLRQWDRVTFTDPAADLFKASVYMYRANHGQWNTVWNNKDNGPRSGRILDLRYLVPPEAQRRMAEIYITAFLETTLMDVEKWRPIFRDHRVIGEWLPETMYVTRMQHASFRRLAGFEEDIDVTTGTRTGVVLQGDSLGTWAEETLPLRSRNRANTSASQENQAVRLGWNNRIAGPDTTRTGPPARYRVELPPGLAREWGVGAGHSVSLALSATPGMPSPRKDPGSSSDTDCDEDAERRPDRPGEDEADDELPPVDLSVEVTDGRGRSARLPLSRYGPIRRPLDITIWRRGDQEDDAFADRSEVVLQGYEIPLSDFIAVEPSFDPASLRSVSLVFDRAPVGEVLVDDIGLSQLGPAWWDARLR